MATWLTSDLHFGHKNILTYCARPFDDLNHMHEMLIKNFNELVGLDDLVYFVGDMSMGQRDQTLPLFNRLNGYKVLIPGNHDYCHPMHGDVNFEKWKRHCELYAEFFDDIIYDNVHQIDDFVLCHFPYNINSSQDDDRNFGDYEPMDIGMPLLCGHVHEKWRINTSKKGTFMLNVGVDVQGFYPISLDQIKEEYLQFSRQNER